MALLRLAGARRRGARGYPVAGYACLWRPGRLAHAGELAVGTALRDWRCCARSKRRHPHLRLLAFSVIMRLTITGADAETRAGGRDIFRYSVLRDRWSGSGCPAPRRNCPR